MKISCCVFDLDGTLLTSENKISDIDKTTLKKLSNDGVKIIIATGRAHLQIYEYVHELGISDPCITCNGGQIINILKQEIIHRDFIRKEDVLNILSVARHENIDFLIYTPDYVYHSPGSERIKFFEKYNKTAPKEFKIPILPESEYPSKSGYNDVLKILIHADTKRLQEFEKRFNTKNTLTIVSSGKNLIDIMRENTTKGNGIRILCNNLGIPIDEVVAFGDSMNDEDMLKTAGFSVAMGNAIPEIKNICDYVTLTNDEDGITHAIEHIITEL